MTTNIEKACALAASFRNRMVLIDTNQGSSPVTVSIISPQDSFAITMGHKGRGKDIEEAAGALLSQCREAINS